MKRALLGLSIVAVVIGVGAYASLQPPVSREIARVERAQHVVLSQHMRNAFIAVLGDPQHPAALKMVLIRKLYGARLGPEKTLGRRFAKAVTERVISARYDDEALLRTYLDQIYMGQDAERQIIIGVESAAMILLRKDLSEVTLPEAALLAGIHRSPNHSSPLKNPERAFIMRNLVLKRMLELRLIRQPEYELAVSTSVTGW